MLKHRLLWFGLITGLAVALTWFYQLHEGLPRYLRAPTSLILAPIAIVDGLYYARGIAGINGNFPAVFIVNWLTGLVAVEVCLGLHRLWQFCGLSINWQERRIEMVVIRRNSEFGNRTRKL